MTLAFPRIATLATCLLLLVGCSTPELSPADRIQVNAVQSRWDVTVPKSKLVLSLPKGDLQIAESIGVGAAASPRYFVLKGRTTGTIVSGWFEPAERQSDLRASWRKEMEGLKQNGFAPPTNIEETEVNGMETILYGIPMPKGSSAHARCSFVRSGTWLDLHLSISGDGSPAQSREQLVALLRTLQITDKP